MLTFEGKPSSFLPGKEVPNKEPPVSKFVVEKLYKVHRERLRDMQPVVDCHVEIPDFLTNQSWKKITEEHRREVIRMHNEVIYQRIAKVENAESAITVANRKHIKHVENELKLMKNLKEKGRVRNMLKIQRENEDLLQRIERARPEYTRKNIKEWYRHHELFKKGRRSDPTAGHLGFRDCKGLFPTAISRAPPSNVEMALDAASLRERSSSVEALGSAPRSQRTPKLRASTASAAGFGMMSSNEASKFGEAFPYTKPQTSPQKGSHFGLELGRITGSRPSSAGTPGRSSHHHSSQSLQHLNEKALSDQADVVGTAENSPTEKAVGTQEGFHVLLSRPFAVPFEGMNCIVYILACSREYDENLYIRVMKNSTPPSLHSERPLSIDAAHDIVYSSSTNSILYGANNDDLLSLRGLLVNMFKEADDDGNGYLTFDEFEELMGKVELGISSSELRFVIQEADDNDDGVVDYDEFVPLAVDMIQSFRARNKAKIFCSQRDTMIEEEVMTKMRSLDFDEMTQVCIQKIQEFDPKKFGVLRVSDLKKALISVSFSVGLTELEIQMICNRLPLDQFGRTLYNNIGEILQKVRFINLKLQILESQASELHFQLLEACKHEERMLKKDLSSDDQALTGELPVPNFQRILSNLSKFTLSRLQVFVIMADSASTTENAGICNYQSFLPVVSKTVEYMFEPKALRQRAELIENSEITSETLSKSIFVNATEFDHRLKALYDACDVDQSNGLDEEEFLRCLQSLELELTGNEIKAYYGLLHQESKGGVSYQDFKDFFVKNITEMEKIKHMRILQSRLHRNYENEDAQALVELSVQRKDLMSHLQTLFENLDFANTGFIEHHELEEIIKGLEIDLTQFEHDILFSEVETDAHGFVDYHSFLPVCADLMQAFIAKKYALAEDHKNEKVVAVKADRVVASQLGDLRLISKRLYGLIQQVDFGEKGKTDIDKLHEVQEILRKSHSGLTRTESNDICRHLFESKLMVHETADGHIEADDDQHSPPDSPVILPAGEALKFREDGSLDVTKDSNPKAANKVTSKLVVQKHKSGRAQSMIIKNAGQEEFSDSITESKPKPRSKKNARHTSVVVKSGKVALVPNATEVQVMKKADRLMKNYTQELFFELVVAARKRSVMRGMLHNMSKSAVSDFILHSMEHRRNALVAQRKLDAQSIYVPTQVCFQVLEDATALRLSRSQIIALISTCDAFDKTGMNVDYKLFSANASHVIEKLFDTHHQLNRANVLDIAASTADEALIMNGLTEEDCKFYLETAFNDLANGGPLVPNLDFISVLKDIPLLKLSDKDAVTVFAASQHNEAHDAIYWLPCLSWIYETLHMLLKERFLQRRMALLAATVMEDMDKKNVNAAEGEKAADSAEDAENEAVSSLKSLAEKLVDFIKVRMDNGVVRVFLPTDKDEYGAESSAAANENQADEESDALEGLSVLIDIPSYRMPVQSRAKRGGQQVLEKQDSFAATSTAGGSSNNLKGSSFQGVASSGPLGSFSEDKTESSEPFAAGASGAKNMATLRRQSSVSATAAPRIPAELTGHLKIVSNERDQSVDKELTITFVAEGPSGLLSCSHPGTLKLPSMCVVDRETALEFAANLAGKLVVDIQNPMSQTHNLVIR